MKKHKKQAHAHKSKTRHKAPTTHRSKAAALEDKAGQEQKTDVSWQPEESREGPDALNVHENGPVSNDVIGESETK